MIGDRVLRPTTAGAPVRAWKRPVALASAAAVIGSMALLGGVVQGVSAAAATSTRAGAGSSSLCGTVTMYEDSVRVPDVADYEKAHPCVQIEATVFPYGPAWQAKIGLFNKEGSGWPDIAW